MQDSLKHDGRPSLQFYPDKWYTDKSLRLCGLAARGLWIDMLCIMFESPVRGCLYEANGKQIEAGGLAKLVSDTEANVKQLLSELETHGVYSTLDDGTIYNRRMYRDWKQSRSRAEAGRKGGLASKTEAKGPPSSTSSASSAAVQPENPKKDSLGASGPTSIFKRMAAAWNLLPECYVRYLPNLEPTRNKKLIRTLSARLKETGWHDDAAKAYLRIKNGECKFFGSGERAWKPDMEWFLKPTSVTNVLAGKYDRGDNGGQREDVRPEPKSLGGGQ
jgi:hypothetical protein